MSFVVAPPLSQVTSEIVDSIRHQMASRSVRAANELRNAELEVLSGQGGGRRYRMPHSKAYYTASAPGQPPARRSGVFRLSWQPSVEGGGDVFIPKIESSHTVNGYVLGSLLEDGTSKMAPRPHHDRIKEKAEPSIVRIYAEPYF